MMTKTTRKIVRIDEDKCNGCGQCVPNCAEGAIRIIDGKAKLAAENLCDGLGNCLGTCPQDAITIEERPADAFDEEAVERHLSAEENITSTATGCPGAGHFSCPGAAARMFETKTPARPAAVSAGESQLRHWPVQLSLVPTAGPMWDDADVLIAADCVAHAMPDFHERFLAGKSLAIACPKLDDLGPYVQKLTEIFAGNTVRSVTVAHMEVPCCTGIVRAVEEALQRAEREDIELNDVTVGVDGTIRE